MITTPRTDRYDQVSLTSETIRQSNRLHKAANESGSKFFDAKNSEAGTSRRFLEKVNRAGGKLPLQDMYPEQQGYFNDVNTGTNEVEQMSSRRINGNPKNSSALIFSPGAAITKK